MSVQECQVQNKVVRHLVRAVIVESLDDLFCGVTMAY